MTIRLTGTRGQINLAVVRLRHAFATVEAGDVYVGDDGFIYCDVTVTF